MIIKVRPIYHYLADRVRAHVFLCLNNPAFGDAPRTMTNCRSPWMTTLNASLSKKINITERVYAQDRKSVV